MILSSNDFTPLDLGLYKKQFLGPIFEDTKRLRLFTSLKFYCEHFYFQSFLNGIGIQTSLIWGTLNRKAL